MIDDKMKKIIKDIKYLVNELEFEYKNTNNKEFHHHKKYQDYKLGSDILNELTRLMIGFDIEKLEDKNELLKCYKIINTCYDLLSDSIHSLRESDTFEQELLSGGIMYYIDTIEITKIREYIK